MKRLPRPTIVAAIAAVLAFGFVVPAVAQDARTDFTVESRLLENDLETYSRAREREDAAVGAFRRLSEEVHRTLIDPNVALSTLRDLEARLSAARETAYLRSKETGSARLRMYDRMERLAQLARAVERSDPATLTDSGGLGGLWQIELEARGVWGLMKLVIEGQLATGSYRLSNGNHGSLRGTWTGGKLRLEVIHSGLGLIASIEGELDGELNLHGRWNAMELGAGQIEADSWTAYRVSDDLSLDLEN